MIFAIALFIIGSGLAGGATSAAMLIAARTIQGLGTGGLYVLSDIIICDLIPPRFRGPYLSAVLGTAAIGTTVGPIIGGAFAQVNWRWVFVSVQVSYIESEHDSALSRVGFLSLNQGLTLCGYSG